VLDEPGERINGIPFATLGYRYDDFHAYLPTHSYLHVPSQELWPGASVNAKLPPRHLDGAKVKPSLWLDVHRPVMQMEWVPGEPALIENRVMQAAGWHAHTGARIFNLYNPPRLIAGDARKAGPWLDHLHRIYPEDAGHIANWIAHTTQHPGTKINHALLLSGQPGIGKDTLLEPVRAAVGAHNFADVSPPAMLGRFSGWVRNVIVRVSEVRDLGEINRFAFYEHCKPLLASPPDAIRVDEKHLREYFVMNCCCVIFTSNHLSDGLYLPADDRRHYVAWSDAKPLDFDESYWRDLWAWYVAGGIGHVCAWLRERDLSKFDPKAPPAKTAAFWTMVAAGESPERGEMRDLLELLGNPPAFTMTDIVTGATRHNLMDLERDLTDRKNRRSIPHQMERAGYVAVRNPNADDWHFKVTGKRCVIYAQSALTLADQLRAAQKRMTTGHVL
jgi:hypothetical protein